MFEACYTGIAVFKTLTSCIHNCNCYVIHNVHIIGLKEVKRKLKGPCSYVQMIKMILNVLIIKKIIIGEF